MHRGLMAVSVASGLIAVAIFILVIVAYASAPRVVIASGPAPLPTFAQPVDAEIDYHPANNPAPIHRATSAPEGVVAAQSAAQSSGQGVLTTAAPAPSDNNPYTIGR